MAPDPVRWEGSYSILGVLLSLVRVYVMLRKMRQQRLLEDGIMLFPPQLHSNDASSVVRECVKVCNQGISRDSISLCLLWVCLNLIFICLC